MPKVSGLIVPKLCHRCHDGNIRCLEPVAPFANHHDYGSGEDEEAQNKEEPEEPEEPLGNSDRGNSRRIPCIASEPSCALRQTWH